MVRGSVDYSLSRRPHYMAGAVVYKTIFRGNSQFRCGVRPAVSGLPQFSRSRGPQCPLRPPFAAVSSLVWT